MQKCPKCGEALAAPAPRPLDDAVVQRMRERGESMGLVTQPTTEREAERPVAGQIWEHANGNRYVIVAMANIELGKEEKFPLSVIYRNTLRDTLYVRRMSDWPGRMTPAGKAALEASMEKEDE